MTKSRSPKINQHRRGKPKGALSKNTLEFQEAYRELIQTLNVDPLVVMFKLCKSRDLNIRFHAAKELLPYRYPKQASIQIESDAPTQITFAWEDETDALPHAEQPEEPVEKVIN